MGDNKIKALSNKASAPPPPPPVLTLKCFGYGQIIFNRPKKLNPIIYEMTQRMIPFVEACETDDKIKYMVLKGAGRAFCAGGDIKEILEGITGDIKYISNLYIGVYDFHRLVYLFATVKKPLITIMDGLTVGGGVGYSQVSSFKIATENTKLCAPECAIGHFTDAGNTFNLATLDGHIGVYLALTGDILHAEDVLFAGLATHFVKSENLETLQSALAEMSDFSLDAIDATIHKFAVKRNHITYYEYTLHGEKLDMIKRCFKYDSVEEIVAALKREGSNFSKHCLKKLAYNSPTSLKLTLMLVRQGQDSSFAECLSREYYYWRNLHLRDDYREGMLALLEKRPPQWKPAKLAEVDLQEMMESENCIDLLAYPRFNPNTDFKTSPYKKYTLPNIEEVQAVKRKHNLRSKKDVISWYLENDRGEKFGVSQKLESILMMETNDNHPDDLFAKL